MNLSVNSWQDLKTDCRIMWKQNFFELWVSSDSERRRNGATAMTAIAQRLHSTRKAMAYVNVSGGVAGDPIHHINLLKVSFSSQIAATPPFFSATCALSAAPTGIVFISLVCCFCSVLDEVARAKIGSLRPNRLPYLFPRFPYF
jgi:hypothetical protein